METEAPAVVAVVVSTGLSEHLEATLASLASQDYSTLSTLVVVNGGDHDPSDRIKRVLPSAFVARSPENRGFGAAVNSSLEMVQGAQFLLLCHDDVVLAPDAVHQLVEESFRSNAGIITPKYVTAADPSIILHVGQSVDRFGTVVERVQPGEFDQGQHDAVRDVFIAPGGVQLVRDDLLRLLGGFDESLLAFGEDLDLSWRAHVVGARIVCAPQAVVGHREALVNGERDCAELLAVADLSSQARLRRRNQIRTLVVCWGRFERVLTLLLLALFDLGEVAVSLLGRDVDRAVDIREAWRLRWRNRRDLGVQHARLHKIREMNDRTIRKNQSRGARRFRLFLSRLVHNGYDVARGALAPGETTDELEGSLEASFGGAFSDDEGFDELDDLGRRQRHQRGKKRLTSGRSVFVLSLVAVVVYLVGSRNILGSRLPLVGQLVPLGSWTSLWHHVLASWQSPGIGNGAPTHPGYAVFALASTLTLGHVGIIERLIFLGALPFGAWGVSRLIKPVATARARLLGAVAYGGVALGANAIAAGRFSSMVAIGVMPFLILRLLRLTRTAPFDEPFGPSVRVGTRGWRASRAGSVTALALLLTVSGALDPALLVIVLVAALGSGLAGVVIGAPNALRGLGRVLGAVVVAMILVFPLTATTVLSGWSGFAVFGVAGGPWANPGLGGLLRFAVGPNGGGALEWLLPCAALVPLVLARARRFGLAAHLAGIGLAALALALFVARGGAGTFAPDLMSTLAPLAVAIATLVGLGLAAFDEDLASLKFSWRQIVGILGVAAALVGLLPLLGSAGNGRWKMPITGYSDSLSFLNAPASMGHRILWLGNAQAIPGSSWPVTTGLAWSTSQDGLPGSSNFFVPPSATASGAITDALHKVLAGQTAELGQLLAPTGVQAIVVVTAVAPTLTGIQTGAPAAPPSTLIPALNQQNDLVRVPNGGGAVVYETTDSLARFSTRARPLPTSATSSSFGALVGWIPVSGNGSAGMIGPRAHVAYVGSAPSSVFSVSSPLGSPTSSSAFGWAKTVTVSPGSASVTLQVLPVNALMNIVMVAGWIVAALFLIGRHRWLDWWWRGKARKDELVAIDEEPS